MSQRLSHRLGAVYRWFRKPKTTVSIIVILLILYVLGLVIPQKVFFASWEEYKAWLDSRPLLHTFIDRLGFTEIYVSPVTLFFLGLFYFNLIAVVIERVPIVLRRAYVTDRDRGLSFGDGIKTMARRARIPFGESSPSPVFYLSQFFRRQGWHVVMSEKVGKLFAVKNRWSAFGFLIFHLSFLFCLTGGLLIYYSRFSGRIMLTEGQAFEGDLTQFRVTKDAKIMRALPPIYFRVDEVLLAYEQDQRADLFASLTILYKGEEKVERIGINQPARRDHVTLLVSNAGISPLFRIRSLSDGQELDGAWFSLNVLDGLEDRFQFDPKADLVFRARFFPDYVRTGKVETSRSKELRNPAFFLRVEQGERTIAEGTILMGQALVFGERMIEFADMRLWAEVQLVREIGPAPLVAGFALAVVGLVMRLVFFRKELRILVEGDTAYLSGQSEYYPHTFGEELDELVQRLESGKGA